MRVLFASILSLILTLPAVAQTKILPIGEKAPAFDLPGVDGKNHKLADFADAKFLVVLFTCNHCPTAQAYEDRVLQLHKDYKDRGVALVAISPNDPLAVRLDELGYTDLNDTLDEMKLRAKDKGFTFPYLYDGENQAVSRAYGVVATPQVYVFDEERKLRYQGRIDDGEVKPATSHDLRNALDALLAGKPVPAETTRVFGCSTKWADKRADNQRAVARWDNEPVALKEIDEAGIAALAKNDGKKLRVINVWATWCGPCVIEMPELVTMHRMYRGRDFELVTISMDDMDRKDKALEMLKQMHVSATNYIYSGTNKDKLVEALDKEWPGPIPHTLIVAPGGKVIYRHTGQFDPMEVKRAIVGHLGRTYAAKQ